MKNQYTINIEIDHKELEEMLYEQKVFEWFYTTIEDKNITIKVNLSQGDEW